MEMFRKTFAEINLDNLTHNIRVLQKAFPQRFLCPMVKANAYGHGDVKLALHLEKLGIQNLGVCLIEEGLLLRQSGVKTNILVFRGFDKKGAKALLDNNMTPVVSTWDQIEALEQVADKKVSVHVKFDTGMNRLGFRTEEAEKVFARLNGHAKIEVKALCTHLYIGENADERDQTSAHQLQKLNKVSEIFKSMNVFCHALNSSGILNLMQLMKDGVIDSKHPLLMQNWGIRPGLMIYGYSSLGRPDVGDLKPVMTLKSVVNNFRQVKKGETVSYGARWTATRDSVIAVISIGYGDGYHRLLTNQTYVLFNGQKAPITGTVCMDYLMVDVTDIVQGKDLNTLMDQEVILFGFDLQGHLLSADEVAKKAHTISYEMLTSVGERVPRVYVGKEIG
ncbi:alanine racemase [Bdellovibrio sp. KM01]|uniref:alanine racemase n=1 Tax=Bdellovibrio sp. KM01 TaxID=2748865 RepID=UPI0015EA2CE2|nr:alanine racemase [Bdellovibrio sp. KM01]QLY26112.1 alanine racemase [Bdellovibrio sp. KM01]